jgi:Cu-Zn family superoxide dismutase
MSATLLTLAIASVGAGCNSDTPSKGGGNNTPKMIASSSGAALMVYDDPYMAGTPQAGMPNPIAKTATGSAAAFDMGSNTMKLTLSVAGLPANRAFGSHLHKLDCGDMKAGGHYENNPWPDASTATDPTYANPMNEAWLDFTTDASGKGTAETTVSWIPRAGGAKAIIVHDMKTATSPMGGAAGAKLACLPITGF